MLWIIIPTNKWYKNHLNLEICPLVEILKDKLFKAWTKVLKMWLKLSKPQAKDPFQEIKVIIKNLWTKSLIQTMLALSVSRPMMTEAVNRTALWFIIGRKVWQKRGNLRECPQLRPLLNKNAIHIELRMSIRFKTQSIWYPFLQAEYQGILTKSRLWFLNSSKTSHKRQHNSNPWHVKTLLITLRFLNKC